MGERGRGVWMVTAAEHYYSYSYYYYYYYYATLLTLPNCPKNFLISLSSTFITNCDTNTVR